MAKREFNLRLAEASEARFTLTATMTLNDWQEIREKLLSWNHTHDPIFELHNAISEMVSMASTKFTHLQQEGN